MKLKKVFSLVITLMMVVTLLYGCGNKNEASTTKTDTKEADTTTAADTNAADTTTEADTTADTKDSSEPITLTLACMGDQADTFEELKIGEAYKATHPNVTIELEKFKDSGTFEDSLKIRASAGQLPDISTLKPYMLTRFAESMMDLADLEATSKNLYATGYAVNGKVVGVPDQATREYVYYWKDMFTELGIEVPTTWDEFIAAAVKFKEAGKVIPIIMGGRMLGRIILLTSICLHLNRRMVLSGILWQVWIHPLVQINLLALLIISFKSFMMHRLWVLIH
jgi:raffinose/stachyose/melibiose transport system substrate-binding protein